MSQFDILWNQFIIIDRTTVNLVRPIFQGPGISQSYKLVEKDRISIDLTKQFFAKLKDKDFLIVDVEWNGVRYIKEDTVELGSVLLRNLSLRASQHIRDSDFLRVYLAGHDDKNHHKNLVYFSEIRNEYGEKITYS